MKRQSLLIALSLGLLVFPWNARAQDPTAEMAPAAGGTAMAIFPFQTRPKIDTRVGASMVARLTNALEAAGHFELLDRTAMANLSNEVEVTRKGEFKTDSIAAWAAERGIRYVITGTVVAAGKGHGGMGVGGVRISAKAISLAVEIRLIDAARGETLIENTYKDEKLGLGLAVGTVDFDPESLRGSEMVVAVLQGVLRDVLALTHPPMVTQLDESGQTVTLNYGANVFSVDDRWELYLPRGAGESSGDTTKMATIVITEVGEAESTGTVVDGTAVLDAAARFDRAGSKRD